VTARSASPLAARRGKLLLLLLCAVQFLDVADSSIMNVALPSIRRDLGFSAQDLQWVLSGYLGGVLSQGPGWRWVLFVKLPVCVLILFGAYRLVPGGRPAARSAGFDVPGAVLATSGMLLLVYALVRAPDQGWGSARTSGELATAAVVLAAFTATELRRRGPLFPFSIFRARGLAAADATQMIAFAAFVSVFYFLTLYMQDVVGFSPIRSGSPTFRSPPAS
jgi:MFS family permease